MDIHLAIASVQADAARIARYTDRRDRFLDALDWSALGLDAASSVVTTPKIGTLQPTAPSIPGAKLGSTPLAVPAGKGVVLVIHPDA